jgi:predicted O-methyltransferase YrrM
MQNPTINFWTEFVNTKGAFSCCEAIALYNIVSSVEQGDFIELGSHRGRSSICIASAMPLVSRLILVEPEFQDKEWSQDVLNKVSKWMPKNNMLQGFAGYSLDVLKFFNDISFCFVDSGLHDDMVMDEVKLLEDKVLINGVIAFHDYGEKSQFTAVTRAYDYLVSTGKYEPILIDWEEIFQFIKDNDLKDGELSWHVYPELPHPPNFVGALRRK